MMLQQYDNMFFRSLQGAKPLHFIDGLGVGFFPKKSKNDKLVNGNSDLYVTTKMKIRAESFGRCKWWE